MSDENPNEGEQDLQFDLINDIESNNEENIKNSHNSNKSKDSKINIKDVNKSYDKSITDLYFENKRRNKQKIETTEFMSYMIKIELLFQTLQGHLYWVSIIEFFIFFILFCFFCASPKVLGKMWWYIFHIVRGIVGIIIIINLPKTFEVINNIKVISENLSEIKNSLIKMFLELLSQKQKKLKLLLMLYFSTTVLCTVIDLMMFCVIVPDCGVKGAEKSFLIMLISSLIFFYCDIIYYNFFSSFKFYFNKTEQNVIQRATVVGFFDQLKIGMAQKIVYITKQIGKVGTLRNKVPDSNENMRNDYNNNNYENNDQNKVREVNIANLP